MSPARPASEKDTTFAVKVLDVEDIKQAAGLEVPLLEIWNRIELEIEIMKLMTHPHIVSLVDVERVGTRRCLLLSHI